MPELGLVGRPVPSAPPAVLEALAAGFVPVVSPLARGPLNVNADEAASALARRHRRRPDPASSPTCPGVYHDGELIAVDRRATARVARRRAARSTAASSRSCSPRRSRRAAALAAEIGVTAVVA